MNIQAIVLALDPVRIIPEAVHSHIPECRIFRKPFPWPIMCVRVCLAPCFPRTAAEAVHENEVDKRFGWGVEEVQSESAFRIIYAIAGEVKGL